MNLFKSFILTILIINIVYGSPTPQNDKLRPWEAKETKEKNEVKSKVSNDKQSGKDSVDIPEDLYNAVKPITQYYFNSIKNLMNGKPAKSQKTKKISTDLFNAAVTPFTSYYAKHLKALQPLGSKVKFTKSSKNKYPGALHDPTSTAGCIQCVIDLTPGYGESDACMLCAWMWGFICCQ